MHVISGLRKRVEDVVMTVVGVTGEADCAKKPTAKEILEDELGAGLEQPKRNLAEVPSGSDGGTDSNNHGSEMGKEQERDYWENCSTATAKKELLLSLN